MYRTMILTCGLQGFIDSDTNALRTTEGEYLRSNEKASARSLLKQLLRREVTCHVKNVILRERF